MQSKKNLGLNCPRSFSFQYGIISNLVVLHNEQKNKLSLVSSGSSSVECLSNDCSMTDGVTDEYF
jgi:hypothetical protein